MKWRSSRGNGLATPPPRVKFPRGRNILGESENMEQVDIVQFLVFEFNIPRVKV